MERTPNFWFWIGISSLIGIQLLFIAGGWLGYTIRDQEPTKEVIKYINQTIEKSIPVSVTVDTKSADFVRINGILVKEIK